MKSYNSATLRLILSIFVIMLLLTASIFGCADFKNNVVYALDTFDVVFPNSGYFQSSTPTFIAVNRSYLAVYDKQTGALFVRSDEELNYRYSLEFTSVSGIYLIGHHAFIVADDSYYTLDLSDRMSTPTPKTLDTPENIYYFYSDGTYLYAKNIAGNLTIYDENMSVALGVDNLYNVEVFAGRGAIAAENGIVYSFTFDENSVPLFNVYDTQRSSLLLSKTGLYIQSPFVGEVIFAQISPDESVENSKHIVAIDKENGDALFTHTLIPDSFTAFEDKLYAIEGERITEYTLKSDLKGLELTDTISMAGNDLNHFDAPQDIVDFDGALVVADGNNDRLAILREGTMTTLELPSSPKRLTADANNIYVQTEDGLYSTDMSQIQKIDFDGKISDIDYAGRLYILGEDSLYTMLNGSIRSVVKIENAKRLASADGGNNIYVLTDDAIKIVSSLGEILISLDADFSEATDFSVDYSGNFFVLYKDKVQKYINTASALQADAIYPLQSDTLTATASSICLDGKTAYFTASECFVGKLTLSATTEDDYSAPEMNLSTNDHHFARLKEGISSYAIDADGRYESVFAAPSDVLLVLDGATAENTALSYALYGSKLILIPKENFESVEPAALSGKAVTKRAISAYSLPYIDSNGVALEEGTHLTLISDVADYDGNRWTIVELDGKQLFIASDSLENYIELPPDADIKTGRAKGLRVGGIVHIYADASDSSPSLEEIVDGTRLQVLGEVEAYYFVKHGDVIGYMRKSEVQVGGLTTVQIISIVLSIFVTIACIVIMLAIHNTKANIEKTKSEKSDEVDKK